MSSARPTPRYVGVIGSEPMGPQLMGPLPAPRAVGGHQPARPSRAGATGNSTGVLPLRPPVAFPDVSTVPEAPIARAGPRTRVVPVHRRPWKVLIVSAAPGAAPRSFDVPRWQARLAIGALVLVTTVAIGAVAAVVVAVRTPDLLMDGTELRTLRSELAATQDSLGVMRASLTAVAAGESGDEAPDSANALSAPAPGAVAPAPATAVTPAAASHASKAERAKAAKAKPGHLLSSAGDDVARHATIEMPRNLSELPVIGLLVSGFSLARRHPLLHITRPHLGVDVAAPRGTRVSAPAAGRVRFVGHKFGFGLVVELDHGNGISTRYAHLRSAAVEPGETVTKGEAIAAVGTSGITTGPHLHYEVLIHGRQVDPLRFHFPGNEPAAGAPVPASVASGGSPAASPSSSGVGGLSATHEGATSTVPSPAPR